MIGLGRHRLHHRRRQRALDRKSEEHVGSLHGLGEAARLGVGGMRRFPLVHAFRAAPVDDAFGIAEDDVAVRHAHGLDELDAGDRRRARAVAYELHFLDVAPGDFERIEEPRGGDDRRAMLVVMKHRNVHEFAQPLLDDETVGRLDVLEIDAAERGPEITHRIDEGIDVAGVHFEIDRIDIGKSLEQNRLAFHHRFRRQRAKIAEAENGGAVGDDRHEIALGGVVVGGVGFLGDAAHRHRHAGAVGKRQIALGRHRLGRSDFELAGLSALMKLQRLLVRKRGSFRYFLIGGHEFP